MPHIRPAKGMTGLRNTGQSFWKYINMTPHSTASSRRFATIISSEELPPPTHGVSSRWKNCESYAWNHGIIARSYLFERVLVFGNSFKEHHHNCLVHRWGFRNPRFVLYTFQGRCLAWCFSSLGDTVPCISELYYVRIAYPSIGYHVTPI